MINTINKQDLIPFVDLTSLNENDDEQSITALCHKAHTSFGDVAAVCIYQSFIPLAKTLINTKKISIATVVNFPDGQQDFETVLSDTEKALDLGATEIDLVVPYRDYQLGNKESTIQLVQKVKQLCEKSLLKVILETGELETPELIYDLSCRVLESGADFIKTSTGKVAIGATLSATAAMIKAIKSVNPDAGLKISGGVKTFEDALSYYQQARDAMGVDWCKPKHLRFGASSLLDHLCQP